MNEEVLLICKNKKQQQKSFSSSVENREDTIQW